MPIQLERERERRVGWRNQRVPCTAVESDTSHAGTGDLRLPGDRVAEHRVKRRRVGAAPPAPGSNEIVSTSLTALIESARGTTNSESGTLCSDPDRREHARGSRVRLSTASRTRTPSLNSRRIVSGLENTNGAPSTGSLL